MKRLPTEHQLTDEYWRLPGNGTECSASSGKPGVDRHPAWPRDIRQRWHHRGPRRSPPAQFAVGHHCLVGSRLEGYRSRVTREVSHGCGTAPARLACPSQGSGHERELIADGTWWLFPTTPSLACPQEFDVHSVDGPLFAVLERHDDRVATALTEVHAASGSEVGWGPRPAGSNYVLLSQVHYLENARPVMYSNTFFVEGRFTFHDPDTLGSRVRRTMSPAAVGYATSSSSALAELEVFRPKAGSHRRPEQRDRTSRG